MKNTMLLPAIYAGLPLITNNDLGPMRPGRRGWPSGRDVIGLRKRKAERKRQKLARRGNRKVKREP